MEGWVSKKRPTGVGKFKMWQKRYLVLNSEHLSYFGENDRKKPKAQFRLNEIESVSLVVSEKKPDHTRFDIVCRPVMIGNVKGASEKDTMKRVYSFRAASPEDAKKWVSIINALAFGETIDVNGDIIDVMKTDPSSHARDPSLFPRPVSSSSPPESANLREVICDRIYCALNVAAILSPSAALSTSFLEADGNPESGSSKHFLSSGGYLCANENNTEEHLKMMIYNELGSDTDLLRFLCGQFYTLICGNNRDGFDSRNRNHSYSASVSQGSDSTNSNGNSNNGASSPTPGSPSMRSPVVKCALKTCKNMRCRLPGILGFRAALEPRPTQPQQLFCTEHAELWVRTSQACAKSLQSPLLGELLEQPPDVLVHELISSLANGTPEAKGMACRLLWVVLPVYLEHKQKTKRRAHARRDERSGSEAFSSASEQANEDYAEFSDLPRLSLSHQNSTNHQRQISTSDFQPRLSNSASQPPTSPRPNSLAPDLAALEETSVVRTVALKTLPKQFAALMSTHCSGQEYSLPIKNALTAIMLRPSARMLRPEDLDNEEQAAMHMVVNHDGACWLAFMVALKCAPFALREQALKEVNMLLIDNPGNCSNFKRQRNWPWLIYSLMSDIPASILGQQTADDHEELTKQRESGLLANVPPPGRDFPSLSFSLSSNSDDTNTNPPTPLLTTPEASVTPSTLNTTTTTTTTTSPLPTSLSVPNTTSSALPSSPPPPPPRRFSSSSCPTILAPHNPSVISPPIPIPDTPTPPSSTDTSSTQLTEEEVKAASDKKKSSLKLFSFEPIPDQPKRGSLSKPPPPPSSTSSTPTATTIPTTISTPPTPDMNKPRGLVRRLSQPDEVPAQSSDCILQPKRGSLKKKIEEENDGKNVNGRRNSNLAAPPPPPLPENSPSFPALSISITDLTPLSLRLPQDDFPASPPLEIEQIDPDLIAVTAQAEEAIKSPTSKNSSSSSSNLPNSNTNNNVTSTTENNNRFIPGTNTNNNSSNNNQRRKGAVFVHKGPGGGTLPTGFRGGLNNRGVSPSRYGTLTGAFAVHKKGEEKNEEVEHNKLIVRVYTYCLNIMTILQYDSALHSSSIHFRQLMLRCLNALLACTGEDKARTLMRPMFITLATKLGTKKVLDRNQLNSLSWSNLFPFFELIKTFLFQTFTFNVLEEAKIRGSSHDRKRTMTRTPSIAIVGGSPSLLLASSSSSSSSSTTAKLPAPFAAWGHEEGFMVDLLPGVDVMGDSDTRRVLPVNESGAVEELPVLGFENGEYGFHLDAAGYYGDIALAERCSHLLRTRGLHVPADENLPGVTSKDLVILREAHAWFEFFEDATELLKLLPPPVAGEKGDVKSMSERLGAFDMIMEAKTLKKFCEATKDGRRSMLKKIKEGPKPSRNPFATPRRSKNNIVIDLSGPKSPTK